MITSGKDIKQLLEGYARVMTIWALLRTIMGLIGLVPSIQSFGSAGFVPALITVLVVIALGIYLGLTGHFGLQALTSSNALKRFKLLCIAGLVIASIAVCAYLYWMLNHIAVQGDLFCVAIDMLLYATGVYYAWRLGKAKN